MTPEQQTLVRGSFAKVAPIAAQAAAVAACPLLRDERT